MDFGLLRPRPEGIAPLDGVRDWTFTRRRSPPQVPEHLAMLRRAGSRDVEAIVSFEADVLNRRLYGQPLDHPTALAEVQANEYFLHLRHGSIDATGAWRRGGDGTAYLSNIAVRPELRRQGLARIMMLHLLDCCGDATDVDLAVHPDNDAARSLYGSLGFHALKLEENYFGDGEPRLIMVLSRRAQ